MNLRSIFMRAICPFIFLSAMRRWSFRAGWEENAFCAAPASTKIAKIPPSKRTSVSPAKTTALCVKTLTGGNGQDHQRGEVKVINVTLTARVKSEKIQPEHNQCCLVRVEMPAI